MLEVDGFWGVVPAGGAGTRLWPLSRAARPKFLLDLTGSGRTLLQGTVDRLAPLTGERVVVVTGAAHAEAVAAQLPQLGADRVLAEPAPRDSMAAIGLAAAVVERADPGAVIGSFAADHVIPDAEAFRTAVREAVEVARDGHLVTLGVEPTHPATGFGYIRAGDALEGFPTARRAREFVEKPDLERATAYLASGEYRWNAGMFVVRAGVLLDLLAQWHPELAAGVRALAADPARLDDIWPGLEKIAIDHAVAEPAAAAGRVVVVPAPFAWDDVGDFAGLSGLLPAADGPVTVVGDPADVTAVDAEGMVVAAGGRRVAVVGLDDVVVVDTPDAVLVTTRARAQDVKQVVDALKASGRSDLT
ncbi:mannose-1-phosphate guanylyltransferase [Nostocoides sp. Soil756]|jgi:mannose-1-phosphate guanylyltransferase|uniref:mannose-1-phosphate guanylyltransferase n=1 Tax=Nostocoides sp. Soil756 TaxID=1736399 RepID=UPI0006F77D88|nr:mannose-1-phosphate guanylyltransferase [Tetrasphaera sp. Soil756]KRE62168.1 mannose-1-phosphate guanylyltransferase [Tetrasphaera sp. Soil756]